MNLDRIDRKILSAVQDDCRIGSEALGNLAGLSPSAAQRRLQSLRKSGVITQEVAIISGEAVGRPLTLILQVTLEGDGVKASHDFRNAMSEMDEVMQCYYITGAADYVLICSAASMAEYDAFTERALFANPVVKTFSTNVVIQSVKTGSRLPLSEPGDLSSND